jgi:hypothetical protein
MEADTVVLRGCSGLTPSALRHRPIEQALEQILAGGL